MRSSKSRVKFHQSFRIALFLGLFPVFFIQSLGNLQQRFSSVFASLATPLPLAICRIQGSGFSSPFKGYSVKTQGIVIADLDQTSARGFYIQSPSCDTDPSTSDGIFVYLGERIDAAAIGDRVQVIGIVDEYYGMTEILVAPQDVVQISHNNPLPSTHDLNPPVDNGAARLYFESLEAMSVRLEEALVVGPTDSDDRTWLVSSALGIRRVFQDDPAGTGEVICVDDGGLFEIEPEAQVSDRVLSITGVLNYRLGIYCIQLMAAPILQPGAVTLDQPAPLLSGAPFFRLATFNLAELFDTVNDPLTEDQVLTQYEYQRRLQKRALAIVEELNYPALLAVQEAENLAVLLDLVASPELQVRYELVHAEGLDIRGLDVALLYRPDLVNVLETESVQGCTNLVDGFEPDGNGDPEVPQNALTCDRDSDDVLDGNRLFSRPPLVVHLWARLEITQNSSFSNAPLVYYDFWVVVVHFKSKVGDSSTTEFTLPRRIEQAQFVASLARSIRESHPQSYLAVLGDFNDYPDSQPLATLKETGLLSAMDQSERELRYSYNYHGVSQVLDDILFIPQIPLAPGAAEAIHINSDYPYSFMGISDTCHRSSDHDPVIVDFRTAFAAAYLPLVFH